jgi:hypothetical protein
MKLTYHLGSVMGLFPIFLNMLQFWLIDSIVKASDSMGFINALSPPVDESREPLFMNEQDSDGEDGPGRQTSMDLEGGYLSPTNRAAGTHSLALPPSSLDGKLDKESTGTKLDESGKSRTSIEFQQPGIRRRSPPLSPRHGSAAESLTGWGAFDQDDPGWNGEQDAESWGAAGAGAGKQRSPKLGMGRRSLSIGRGRRVSGGSGSWKLDTITPSHEQAPT